MVHVACVCVVSVAVEHITCSPAPAPYTHLSQHTRSLARTARVWATLPSGTPRRAHPPTHPATRWSVEAQRPTSKSATQSRSTNTLRLSPTFFSECEFCVQESDPPLLLAPLHP